MQAEMGVLVAETPKSFSSLVSARAKEAGGVVMMGRFGQDEEADDDDDAAAYRRQAPGHQEQDGPEHRAQHAVPDKDWAPAAPPRPKKKWIRHFLNVSGSEAAPSVSPCHRAYHKNNGKPDDGDEQCSNKHAWSEIKPVALGGIRTPPLLLPLPLIPWQGRDGERG
ncbi:hypothetical protein FOCC_FOCC006356, partial [Frankliniella occidentalis]